MEQPKGSLKEKTLAAQRANDRSLFNKVLEFCNKPDNILAGKCTYDAELPAFVRQLLNEEEGVTCEVEHVPAAPCNCSGDWGCSALCASRPARTVTHLTWI